MPMLFRRKAIVPVWVIVFGLFALFGPGTVDTSVLLLIVGVVAPVIMLILWREPVPTVAEVLHRVDAPRTE